jgi:hypothetical protein
MSTPLGAPRLDIEAVLFLLETSDRELPFRLLVEQQRFDEAVKTLNERSRLHLNVLQPKLVAAGVQEGRDYAPDDLHSGAWSGVL